MFMLPSLPSQKAEHHELADFAELLAWRNGSTSAREIIAYLGRLDDNQDNIGCDDDEDETTNELDSVMNELGRRAIACGQGYPFRLDLAGSVLRHDASASEARSDVYRYLLLATRLNMKSHSRHASLDGTHLLEELAAHVLSCYLGRERSRSVVFGTAVKGGFAEKVNRLCKDLREGGQFKNPDTAPVNENDGGLDAVGWVPFSDQSRGQLIVFGQCKTGTTWQKHTKQLQPADFTRLWMSDPPLLTPLRALCIAEAANPGYWCKYSISAGLFFDRCRLVDFCEDLPSPVLSKIKSWTASAIATVQLTNQVFKPVRTRSKRAR